MFSRFHTIHERDGQTASRPAIARRHRPRYAQRRAAEKRFQRASGAFTTNVRVPQIVWERAANRRSSHSFLFYLTFN